MNVMRYGEVELSTVPFENYEVLGRVEGVASVENVRSGKDGLFKGDTGKYGSLNYGSGVLLNASGGKKKSNSSASSTIATPDEAALANAVYEMNERANELGADAILFVRSSVQYQSKGSKLTVDVHVTDTAVRLKK